MAMAPVYNGPMLLRYRPTINLPAPQAAAVLAVEETPEERVNRVWAATVGTQERSAKWTEKLKHAIAAGVTDEVLAVLCLADRLSRTGVVVLPYQRYAMLSRGRGWCRRGRGDSAVWGDDTGKGYRVGPGHWTVGGSDGFSRKGQDEWEVEHVRVGCETWTIATCPRGYRA